MVKHDVANGIASKAVVTASNPGLTTTETHVAYNHIVRVYPKAFTGHADTVTRSRLSSDGNVRGSDRDGCLQADDAGHVEHHDAGTTLFTGPAQSAGATVLKAGHDQHFAPTSTWSIRASSFSTGKSGDGTL